MAPPPAPPRREQLQVAKVELRHRIQEARIQLQLMPPASEQARAQRANIDQLRIELADVIRQLDAIAPGGRSGGGGSRHVR